MDFPIYMDYAATPEAVTEMERQFKIDDRVLKFMTVKLQDVFDPDAVREEKEAAAASAAETEDTAESETGDSKTDETETVTAE